MNRTPFALGAALLVLVAIGAVAPDWVRFITRTSLANGLVVLGVMLQMRGGLVSFGQGLYFCVGGYAAGIAGQRFGVTDLAALAGIGMGIALALSMLLGLLLSRYREIFFAMLSLAFSMILYGLLVKAQALGSTDGFNVPHTTLPGLAPEDPNRSYVIYVCVCVVVFASAIAIDRYLRSIAGQLGDAIRDNEVRVEYLGASSRRVLYLDYVLAAVLSALGGVLFAVTNGHVSPDMAYWTTSGEFVFIALLGGTGHVAAPFAGALAFEVARTYAAEHMPYTWQMVMGATMLAVIVFLPGGLWSLLDSRAKSAAR